MRFAIFFLITLCSYAYANDGLEKKANKLPYDSLVPVLPSKPNCRINSIALQFQPELNIKHGCHPYPAVDDNGYISSGLGVSHFFTDCMGSPKGSQVYGRAFVYRGYLAIMYAWYFPRDYVATPFWIGHRHGWEHAILWFGGMTEKPELLAVTAKSLIGYRTYAPPQSKHMDKDRFKLKYTWMGVTQHYLSATTSPGELQSLVMWDDLPDKARASLKPRSWSHFKPPLADNSFQEIRILK
ncbi:putative necrosis inducing protein [Plasmopara halstedii]